MSDPLFHAFVPAATPEMLTHDNPKLQPIGAGNAPVEDSNHQIVVEEADGPMKAIRDLLKK